MAKPIDPKLIARLNQEILDSATRMDEHAKALQLLVEALDSGAIKSTETLNEAIQNAKKLKSINDKSIGKFLKNLKLDDKEITKLIDKFKEIDKLGERGYKRFKEDAKLREKRNDFIEDEIHFTESLTDAFYRLTDEIRSLEKQYRSAGIIGESSMEAVHNAILRAVNVDSIFGPQLIDQRDIDDVIHSMDNFMDTLSSKKIQIGFDSVEVEEGFNKLIATSKDTASAMAVEMELLKNKTKLFAAEMYGYKWFPEKEILVNISTNDKLAGAAYTQTMIAINKVNAELSGMVESYNSLGALSDAQISRLKELGKTELDVIAIAKAKHKLDTDTAILQAYEDRVKLLRSLGGEMKIANKAFQHTSSVLSNMISLVPGPIAEFLGLTEATQRFNELIDNTFKSFIDGIKKGQTATKSLNDAMSYFGGNITKIMSGVGALAIAIAGAYKISSMLSERWKELSKSLGVSLSTAKLIHANTLDMVSASSRYTLNMRELSAIQGEFAEAWGLTFTLADKTALKTAQHLGETAKLFGISEKQAVGLYNEFEKLGANDELAKTLVRNINYVAELNGLSSQMITQDLLDAAETLQTYYAGYPEDAARAAIATRKLGMTLKQAGDIAKRMLNIEGFMTDMYELNAMTGIDLSQAFNLGIAGDIEGMTKSIMDSIGSLNDWSKMDYLQKMKFANTLGMSVEEIAKSLALREKMATMSKEEADLASKYADKLGDVSMLTDAQVKQKLHELDAADRLNNMVDRLKAILIKSILPLAESFGDLLDGLSPAFEILVGLFRIAGFILKKLLTVVKGLLAPFKVVGIFITSIVDGLTSGADIIKSFTSGFDNVKESISSAMDKMSGFEKVLYSIGVLMAGLWAIKSPKTYLKLGLWPITKAFSMMRKMLPSVGGMIGGIWDKFSIPKEVTETAKGGGIIDKLKGMMGFGKKTSASPVTPIPGESVVESEKVHRSILDSVKNFGANLKDVINGMVKGISDVVNNLITSISKPLNTLVKSIGDILTSIIEVVSNAIDSLSSSIGSGIQSILTGIGKGLNSFSISSAIGATSMLILSGAIYVLSKALDTFANVEWSGILKAGVAIGGLTFVLTSLNKVAVESVFGAAALAVMGAALIPLAYGLNMMAGVEWSTLGIAAVAMLGLTSAMAALGTFVMSGVGAVAILAGAAAFAVMGAALIPFANAMKKLSTSTEALSFGLMNIAQIDIEAMRSVMSAIVTFGEGLSKYPVATSDSIGKSILTFATIGRGIDVTAMSINALSQSLIELSKTLESINLDKLNILNSLKATSQNISASLQVNERYSGMASSMPPPKSYTGQSVDIAKTDLGRAGNNNNSTSTQNSTQFELPSPQDLTFERLELYMKRMVDLFEEYSNRPVVVSVGKSDANRIYKLAKPMTNDR